MKNILTKLSISGVLSLVAIMSANAQVTVTNTIDSGRYYDSQNTYGQNGVIQNSSSQSSIRNDSNQKYPELCAVLNRTLKLGDTGNDVKRLQIVLGQEGVAYLGGTGYYGNVTKSAVKIFQTRAGIYPVGSVGPQTLRRMRQLWCQDGTNWNGTPTSGDAFSVEFKIASVGGNNVSLAWGADATSCQLNNVNVPIQGSKTFTIESETAFVLSCYDYQRQNVRKILNVRPIGGTTNPVTAPTVQLNISPNNPIVGQSATLNWTSTNSSYCTVSESNSTNVRGRDNPSGYLSFIVRNYAQTFTVTCYNSAGQSASQTISSSGAQSTNSNISLNVTTDRTNYSVGDTITSTATIVNNSANTITFTTGVCDKVGAKINNYSFSSYFGGQTACIALAQIYNIAPGQSQSIVNTTVVRANDYQGNASFGQKMLTVNIPELNLNSQTTFTVGGSTGNNNNIYFNVTTDKTNYAVGDILNVISTITNNSGNTISFNRNACVALNAKIDGYQAIDFFSDSSSIRSSTQCNFSNEIITLTPGQSRTLTSPITVKAYGNGVSSAGSHNLSISIPELSLNAQTNFTVAGTVANANVTLTTTTDKTNYNVGDAINITSTLRNNSANTVTYNTGNCSTGIDWKINGFGFYGYFANSANPSFPFLSVQCIADSQIVLYPGQSKVFTATLIADSFSKIGDSSYASSNIVHNLVSTVNQLGLTSSASFTVNNNGSTNRVNSVTINTTNANVGTNYNITYNNTNFPNARGVLFNLVNTSGAVVGTISRLPNCASGTDSFTCSASFQNFGNFSWTIPKSIIDTRNDAISCTQVNGETLCGNLIPTGQYKIVATYFTPYNACFGYCIQQPNQQVLGTTESAFFTITNNNFSSNHTIDKFTGTYYAGNVNLVWTGTGSNVCNLYRYSSLGPTDGGFYDANKILISSNNYPSGSYLGTFIATAANTATPMEQFTLDCNGVKANLTVSANPVNTTNNFSVYNLTGNYSRGASLPITYVSPQYYTNTKIYLSLVNTSNQVVGIIQDNLNTGITSLYNWTIPFLGQPRLGGDYKITGENITSGQQYKIRATTYQPYTGQCYEGCPPSFGTILESVDSTNYFTIN